MAISGRKFRYGALAQVFHWLTVLLVLGAYFTAEGGSESRVYSATRASDLALHETLGVLVLVVFVLRLLWRAIDRPPEEPPMPGWMMLASRLTHWLLYALLLLVPGTAIVGAWYEGHPITPLPGGADRPLSCAFGGLRQEHHRSAYAPRRCDPLCCRAPCRGGALPPLHPPRPRACIDASRTRGLTIRAAGRI